MKSKPHSEEVRDDLIIAKPTRVMMKPKNGGTRATLTQEVKDWLKAMIQNHWYLYECRQTGRLRIAFHNHNDAMKYKLVWH